MDDTAGSFCIQCGHRLEPHHDAGRERLRCTACGWIHYLNPIPAAGILLVRDGRVLLGRRGEEPRIGFWGLPAGFEEYDESPSQTAVREAREETGLEIALGPVFEVAYIEDDPRKRALLIVYEVESYSGRMQAGDDVTELKFFPLDALPPDIAFAMHRRIIERYRNELRRRNE